MNRILALLWKDLRLFFGDRKAMLITFLVPIGIASFFGSVFGNASGPSKSTKIPLLVVDADRSPLVAKIVERLRSDSPADPKSSDAAAADKAVKDGKAGVAVTFPKGFGDAAPKAMLGGDPPTVELRYDPSKALEMQVVQGAIVQAAMRATAEAAFGASPNAGRPPFALKPIAQTAAKGDNDDYSGLAHSFAGMAMQGVLFYGINAAMAMLGDRRRGIWRRLRASPVSLTELLLGKALAIALVGGCVLSGVLAFGIVFFRMHVLGSWLGLGLVVAAAATMVAGFGLLVASLGRTEEQSRGLSILAVLAMVMLGGGWFPTFLMPAWVQSLSVVVPVRWALDGFDAMLWRGAGLGAALVPAAGLLAFALVFGVIAAFRFRTMPETA